jgi:hypothetical protein
MSDDALQIEVDSSEVQAMLDRAKAGIPQLIDEVAIELRTDLIAESGRASSRVADSWALDQMGDLESKVSSDVFFAGWLARGTRGHGPVTKPLLVFAIDGVGIHTRFVQGIKADPFDERAKTAAVAAMPSILDRLVVEAGG